MLFRSGIDSATGLAVVMVYRGIVFWLPFLVGAFVIQRMRAFVPSEQALKREPVPLGTVRACKDAAGETPAAPAAEPAEGARGSVAEPAALAKELGAAPSAAHNDHLRK